MHFFFSYFRAGWIWTHRSHIYFAHQSLFPLPPYPFFEIGFHTWAYYIAKTSSCLPPRLPHPGIIGMCLHTQLGNFKLVEGFSCSSVVECLPWGPDATGSLRNKHPLLVNGCLTYENGVLTWLVRYWWASSLPFMCWGHGFHRSRRNVWLGECNTW